MRTEIAFGVGFDRHGNALPDAFVVLAVRAVLLRASELFGGCTLLDGQGAWVNAAGTLALEASKVLVVNHPPQAGRLSSVDLDAQVDELADFIRAAFAQESVNVSQVVASSRFVTVPSR